jgi:TetR/AcrR family transcriptional regulator, cholesterol catabolism regulator
MTKKTTRKEEIFREAALLFKAKGYGAASMRELAERVGLEAASLYNHIKSKEDILKEICFETADKYVKQLDLIENQSSTSIEKIEAILNLHVAMVADCREEVFVCNNEYKHLSQPFLSKFQEVRRGYEKRFLKIIEEGIAKDELKSVDPNIALFTLLSAVRWLENWYKPERNISAKALQLDVTTVLLNGLKKQ